MTLKSPFVAPQASSPTRLTLNSWILTASTCCCSSSLFCFSPRVSFLFCQSAFSLREKKQQNTATGGLVGVGREGLDMMLVAVKQVRRGRNSPQVVFIQEPLLVADDRETLFVLLQRFHQLPVLLILVLEFLRQGKGSN